MSNDYIQRNPVDSMPPDEGIKVYLENINWNATATFTQAHYGKRYNFNDKGIEII